MKLNLLFISAFIALLCFAGLFAGLNIISLILFIIIQIWGLLIPGITIVNYTEITLKDNISKVFLGYATGFSVVTIIYALMIVSNIHHAYPYVLYSICLFSFIYFLIKGYKHLIVRDDVEETFLLWIFVSIVLVGFLVYQLPYRSAMQVGFQEMFFDSTYWFKNCVASTKCYPLPELSVLGNHLYWHLFSCFNIALYNLSTGIEIYDLCFALSYVWEAFLLIGGSYVLFNEFLNKKKDVILCLFILLFCSSIEPLTGVYFLGHLYGTTLGVADGLSLSMFAFVVLFKSYKNNKLCLPILLLAILLYVASVGSKVPNGFIVLIGAGSWYIYDLIKRHRQNWSLISIILVYLFLFSFINRVFVIDGNALVSETSSHKLTFNFATVSRPWFFKDLYNIFVNSGLGHFLSVLMLSIPYLLFTNLIMLLFMFSIIILIRNRLKNDNCDTQELIFTTFLMSVAGIILFLGLNHPGYSQVYFLFAIFPFALLFSFIVFENSDYQFSSSLKKCLYILITFSFLVNVFMARWTFNISGKIFVEKEQISNTGTSISIDEMIGLRWVRDNLPDDAILVTNKVLEPLYGKKSFVTSAYSEHQVFLEGYIATNLPNNHIVKDRLGLISEFYNGDNNARKALRAEGVSYSVCYKHVSIAVIKKEDVIFENQDIIVSKL